MAPRRRQPHTVRPLYFALFTHCASFILLHFILDTYQIALDGESHILCVLYTLYFVLDTLIRWPLDGESRTLCILYTLHFILDTYQMAPRRRELRPVRPLYFILYT